MSMVEEEAGKQIAAGSDDRGMLSRTFFDLFGLMMQQFGRLEDKLGESRGQDRQA